MGQDGRVQPSDLIEPVSALVREVAEAEVMSRFGRLTGTDIGEKSGSEAVTVADREAERAVFAGLAELVPDAVLVGEESASADPGLLGRAMDAPIAFVVDPIDGTSNFIAGSPDFAVMVAFVVDGITRAAWIHQPVHDRLYTAVLDRGARVDGEPLRREPIPTEPAEYRGALSTWGLRADAGDRVRERAGVFAEMPVWPAASGIEYPRLARGQLDFILWSRTRVWDHAPGSLLVAEAGGESAAADGTPYTPWRPPASLIVASTPTVHRRVREILAPNGVI